MALAALKSFVTFAYERLALAIVAVGGVAMAILFVAIVTNASHIGSYGIQFRGNTDVVDVRVPQGDLRSGDRIDLAALTPAQRFSLLTVAPENATLAVTAIRDGRSFPVTLTSVLPAYSRPAELARDVGIPVCFVLSLGLASVLLVVRPRASTLAFYVYVLLMLVKVNESPLNISVWPFNFAGYLAQQFVYPLAQLAILVFAQRLYGRRGRSWPWIAGAAAALSVVVLVVWLDPTLWITTQHFGIAGPGTRLLMALSDAALLVVVLSGLAYIASGAEGLERGRVTWIVAGIALAPILDLTWALADITSALAMDRSAALLAVEWWTDALQPWFGLLGVMAVLYGFLSQRVIDIRVVIGRAAIYGAMTVMLVVVFGAVEWLAEQIFETTRPAEYVSLLAALLIGFAMRAVHGNIEGFMDRVLFRGQHRAEEALRRCARALPQVTSEEAAIDLLVVQPYELLEIVGAALFVARPSDGVFERVAERGFDPADVSSLQPEDALVMMLRAEQGPIALDPRLRASLHLPGGTRADALAVPLLMRGGVYGVVFYGERRDGAAFTEAERGLLAALVAGGGAAYDHIDADRSRARIRELEAKLAELAQPIRRPGRSLEA